MLKITISVRAHSLHMTSILSINTMCRACVVLRYYSSKFRGMGGFLLLLRKRDVSARRQSEDV